MAYLLHGYPSIQRLEWVKRRIEAIRVDKEMEKIAVYRKTNTTNS